MACAWLQPRNLTLKKTRTRKTPAEKSRAFAASFPPHPKQSAFLAAAVALRAADPAGSGNAASPGHDAIIRARAEFEAAIHAIMFPPSEGRFYFLWASATEARLLMPYTQTAWRNARGEYGEQQPSHWDAKRPSKKN